MFDIPIRKKARNYPKDFTPPAGYFQSQSSSKQKGSINEEKSQYTYLTSFRSKKSHIIDLNRSTQLQQIDRASKRSDSNFNFNFNPQQFNKKQSVDAEKQLPLLRNHLSKKQYYINPDLLSRPRIQENIDKQLVQIQQGDYEESTPGSIRKNIDSQKPLEQEQPNYINVPTKQVFSARKLESNQNKFYQSLRSQHINYGSFKDKKNSYFFKGGASQPQNMSKLLKKQQELQAKQSYLQTPKQRIQQKNKLLEFGPLLQEKRLDKLKAHINQIAFDKVKHKQKVNYTNQTQADKAYRQHQQNDIKNKYNFKILQNSQYPYNENIYSQLGKYQQNRVQSYAQDVSGVRFDTEKQSRMRFASTPKSTLYNQISQNKNGEKYVISYKKTSLNQLHQLFATISKHSNADIQISVPNILMSLNFNRNLQKSQLYAQSIQLFQQLGFSIQNISVKRYSNCVLIVSKNICVLWHYDGKVYLGGWQTKYLDEGVKHGLGLQWVPNKHVYYGQFVQSKKQGLGIMKTKDQIYFGQWARGKRTDNGHIIYKNGQIQHQNTFVKISSHNSKYEGFQSDPFL